MHTEDAMAKAIWNGAVLAESKACIPFERDHYFPPDAIKHEYFNSIGFDDEVMR
jgi:uncharacterized protein (DUF427 family)